MTESFSKSELSLLTKHEDKMNLFFLPWHSNWKLIHSVEYPRTSGDIRAVLALAITNTFTRPITANMYHAIETGCRRLEWFLERPEKDDWRSADQRRVDDVKKSQEESKEIQYSRPAHPEERWKGFGHGKCKKCGHGIATGGGLEIYCPVCNPRECIKFFGKLLPPDTAIELIERVRKQREELEEVPF